jgi:hypothetical protein
MSVRELLQKYPELRGAGHVQILSAAILQVPARGGTSWFRPDERAWLLMEDDMVHPLGFEKKSLAVGGLICQPTLYR